MRVVIHVGAHKTGTSLVQKYFRDNPEITEALGIAQISRTDGDVLVDWGQFLHERPEALRSRLEEEAAKRPSLILFSHENTLGQPFLPDRPGLYPDASRNAKALAGICDGFETHVVFYVRPMADFLESYYIQTVQEGLVHSFADWYGSLTGSTLWSPVVEALEGAFGADRVIVGDFAEMSAGQNQFLRQFMTRTGIPQPPSVKYRPIRNPSISARGLEIAFDINQYLHNDDERMLVRRFLQKHFSNQKEDRARPMPEELRRSITDGAAAEYERLAARAAADLASPPQPPLVPLLRVTATRYRMALRRRVRRLINRVRARDDS
jgi:hypothetical protein